MSAGGDIFWTSLIPGLNNVEKVLAEKPKEEGGHGGEPATVEGTQAAAAHAPVGEPALHVSGAIVIFFVLIVLALWPAAPSVPASSRTRISCPRRS